MLEKTGELWKLGLTGRTAKWGGSAIVLRNQIPALRQIVTVCRVRKFRRIYKPPRLIIEINNIDTRLTCARLEVCYHATICSKSFRAAVAIYRIYGWVVYVVVDRLMLRCISQL